MLFLSDNVNHISWVHCVFGAAAVEKRRAFPTFWGILGCRIKLLFEEKVGLKTDVQKS